MADINKVLGCFNDNPHPRSSKDGTEYRVHCPCHDDKKASLIITDTGNEKILMNDLGGCSTIDILNAVGLSFSDLEPEKEFAEIPEWKKDLEAEYRYYDENSNYQYSKLRYPDKKIRYAIVKGNQIKHGMSDAEKTLYHLPDLIKAIKEGRTVYYVEGEKDVRTLESLGLTATTAGSVNDWKKSFARYFKGANVVILPDNDEAGKNLAKEVSHNLKDIAFSRKIVFTSEEPKGDVTDFIEKEGHSKSDLMELINETEPQYASWVYATDKKIKINAGLLASAILQYNHIFVAQNPGTKSDQLFWYLDGVYCINSEFEIESKIAEYLPKAHRMPALLKNVSELIKVDAEKKQYDDLSEEERFINLKNGLYDTENQILIPHDPELCGLLQLNCNYHIDERTGSLWEKYIDDLCKDSEGNIDLEMRDVMQEWTGIILSSMHGYRIKKSLVLSSPEGNTGKSVYFNVIGKLLGMNNISNITFQELSSSRWAIGNAFGKRLIVAGDQGSEKITNSTTFKNLTGGDVVKGELKGIQHFNFRYKGLILIACNNLPVFDDDKGEHMAERLMLLDCRNVIREDKRDPYLSEKLLKEKDAIFHWALKGFERFKKNKYRFSECESSKALMDRYRKRYDSLYAFITDNYDRSEDYHATVKKTDFANEYLQYCTQNDITALSKKNIEHRMASLGFPITKLHGYDVYRGLQKPLQFETLTEEEINAALW